MENLRKRGLDSDFPSNDLDLIFEEFDKKNEGIVAVDSLISKSSTFVNHDKEQTEEMLAIRAFLQEQLNEHQKEVSTIASSTSPSKKRDGVGKVSTNSGRKQPLPDEKALVKQALGQKTFDLDVDTNDLNEVIENVFHKHHTIESHNKFARFLRLFIYLLYDLFINQNNKLYDFINVNFFS
jgi:hypothetical protein